VLRLIDGVSWVTIVGTIVGVVGAAAVIAVLFPL
jgi:hypothetical protein